MNVFEQSQKDFDSLVESVVALLDDIESQRSPLESQCRFPDIVQDAAFLTNGSNMSDADFLYNDVDRSFDSDHNRNNNQPTMLQSTLLPSSLYIGKKSQEMQEGPGCSGQSLKEGSASILSFDSDNCLSVQLNPFANMTDDSESECSDKLSDGKKSLSIAGSFPRILYEMLDDSDVEGFVGIVSWQHHGKAFRVHNPKQFATCIMCRYFHQTRYTSFQRQLALYGFRRIRTGKDRGAYYHEQFIRENKSMCISIQRTPIKGAMAQNLTKVKDDPNFYSIVQTSNDSEHETAYL
jgi:HSF-type DNA-binding